MAILARHYTKLWSFKKTGKDPYPKEFNFYRKEIKKKSEHVN